MKKEQMKKILLSFVPEVRDKDCIHEFAIEGELKTLGISLENIEQKKDVLVYNIFVGDEYINIGGYGTQKEPLPDEILEEITATWNKLSESTKNVYNV